MMDKVRLLLADDHAILRSGLRLLLNSQPDYEVVGEAENGREALQQAQALHPDVLLLDINMPEIDGLSLIPMLKAAVPQVKILVLTMHEDASYLQQAVQAGASGYVLKRAVDLELLMAIKAVLRGELYVHSAMTQKLLNLQADVPAAPPPKSDPWTVLSEREFAVLKRVAQGYTNAEIAEDLFLSTKTVETYRARGMEKMELQNRAQLVKSALEHGHLD